MKDRSVRTFPFLLIWALFSLLALPTAYWRDGAEFVISAALLDIPHVAGFPVYNILANLFTLIPIGPIAWRVHLFSAALSTLHLALLALLIARISTLNLCCAPGVGKLIGILTALLLLSSEAYLRQSLTAEVYMLNSAFVVGLLLIAHSYLYSQDARLLPMLAFVGALALGNHLSIALVILPCALILCSKAFRDMRRTLGIALLATVLGVSVYLYVPMRAAQPLALNTGSPTNITRLVQYFTNARDRELRPAASPTPTKPFATPAHTIANDFKHLTGEISPALLAMAPLGALLLALRGATVVGLLIAAAGVGNYLFFQGWESDPWIPLFSMMYALIGTGIGAVVGLIRQERQWTLALPLVLLVSLPASPTALLSTSLASDRVQQYEAPTRRVAARLLEQQPFTVFAAESQWFLVRYLQYIEGLRTDMLTLHTPQLLFPSHFRELDLTARDGARFPSSSFSTRVAKAEHSPLTDFVGFVSQRVPLVLEPSPLVNGLFRAIAILHPSGLMELRRGIQGSIDPAFNPFVFGVRPEQSIALAQRDEVRSTEMLVGPIADLLAQKERPEVAANLLEAVCGRELGRCSPITLNNLGVYWLRAGRGAEAREVFTEILRSSPTLRSTALENLRQTDPELKKHPK